MDYKEKYEAWRNSPHVPETVKFELNELAGDDRELRLRFAQDLKFGTAGLRGLLGAGTNRMNLCTVGWITAGIAKYMLQNRLDRRGVVIGRDSRLYSRDFAEYAARVFAGLGVRVYLFDDIRPTAEVSFAVRTFGAAFGVNVTASHNPKDYNGYKVYGADGVQITEEMAAKITESAGGDMIAPVCLCDLAPAMDVGLVELIGPELDEAYLRAVEACAVMPAPRGKNACKSVYTPLYGSGYKLVPEILRRRGVNVVTCAQHMRPNGNFPGANPPNPEELRAFGPALALAEAEGADVVLGTDPDADRLGAVIRQGGAFTPLTGNQIGVLLLEHILRKKSEAGRLPAKGFAVKSVVSTGLAQPICDKYGVRLEQVPVGFKYTGEKIGLLEDGGDETFLFGFEESSGFLGGSYTRDKDAVYGAMQFAELALDCKNQGITVLDRLDALYAEFGYYTEKTFGLSLDPAEGAARLKQAMDGLRACPPKQIGGCAVERVTDYMSGVDGLPKSDVLAFRLAGGTRLILRPSGTEPKVKIYVLYQAQTKADAAARIEALAAAAKELIGL